MRQSIHMALEIESCYLKTGGIRMDPNDFNLTKYQSRPLIIYCQECDCSPVNEQISFNNVTWENWYQDCIDDWYAEIIQDHYNSGTPLEKLIEGISKLNKCGLDEAEAIVRSHLSL